MPVDESAHLSAGMLDDFVRRDTRMAMAEIWFLPLLDLGSSQKTENKAR
jgi:hypothetical protein